MLYINLMNAIYKSNECYIEHIDDVYKIVCGRTIL